MTRLPQSKSYLKIVSIPYLSNQTNTRLSADKVEKILKNNHIFNNIILASKPRVIKVSPKLDMSIVWIDIGIASLDKVVNEFASTVNNAWEKNSKIINVMKYFKSW